MWRFRGLLCVRLVMAKKSNHWNRRKNVKFAMGVARAQQLLEMFVAAVMGLDWSLKFVKVVKERA